MAKLRFGKGIVVDEFFSKIVVEISDRFQNISNIFEMATSKIIIT